MLFFEFSEDETYTISNMLVTILFLKLKLSLYSDFKLVLWQQAIFLTGLFDL